MNNNELLQLLLDAIHGDTAATKRAAGLIPPPDTKLERRFCPFCKYGGTACRIPPEISARAVFDVCNLLGERHYNERPRRARLLNVYADFIDGKYLPFVRGEQRQRVFTEHLLNAWN